MTYRNGVIAATDSLDEVLSQENTGSGEIVRLKLEFRKAKTPYRIRGEFGVMLEFINVDVEDEPRSIAIRFSIDGQTRDWVFVTSTVLEERVTKIKRLSFNQLNRRGLFPPL